MVAVFFSVNMSKLMKRCSTEIVSCCSLQSTLRASYIRIQQAAGLLEVPPDLLTYISL